MKIGELSRISGLTIDTLRYYESIGLLPLADRDAGGHRDYDASILTWIEFLARMKTAGMPLKDMLRYARLLQQGPDTVDQRCKMLQEQRERVRGKIESLQSCMDAIDKKILNLLQMKQG